jgi:hypothetical protein
MRSIFARWEARWTTWIAAGRQEHLNARDLMVMVLDSTATEPMPWPDAGDRSILGALAVNQPLSCDGGETGFGGNLSRAGSSPKRCECEECRRTIQRQQAAAYYRRYHRRSVMLPACGALSEAAAGRSTIAFRLGWKKSSCSGAIKANPADAHAPIFWARFLTIAANARTPRWERAAMLNPTSAMTYAIWGSRIQSLSHFAAARWVRALGATAGMRLLFERDQPSALASRGKTAGELEKYPHLVASRDDLSLGCGT